MGGSTWRRRARAALACLALPLGACAPPVPQRLEIATNVWPGYEPLYLARDRGLLDPAIDFVECTSASDVMRVVRHGAVDAAALTLDEVLLVRAAGVDLRVVLVLDVSHGADAIVAQPSVTSLAGLRGKRVGVENTAVGGYVLARAMQIAGLARDDLRTVHLVPSEQQRAFVERQVDAVVTFEPTRSLLLAQGGHVVFDSTQLPNEIIDVLAVRAEVLARPPSQLRALTRAWFGALAELERDPQEAAALMAGRLRLPPEGIIASLGGLRFPSIAENRAFLRREGGLARSAAGLAASMIEHGLLTTALDTTGISSDVLFKEPSL